MSTAYGYLGLGTIVREDFQQPQVKLDYDPAGDNSYTGLDRFGRVADQLWAQYGDSPATMDEYTYTYDRAGNVVTKTNATNAALNDQFSYDGVNRLTEWDQGSTPVMQKQWSLDSLGNNLSSGTYNAANEETPNVGSSGYDAAGNMTTLTSGDTVVFDAWNRLVEIDNGSAVVEKYSYDGTNRRVQIFSDFTGGTPGTVVDDYLAGQQVVESDVTTGGDRNGGYQYVWSPRYIDAPVVRDTLTTDGTGIVSAGRIFYLGDANYNVTAVVKYDSNAGSWQVVERYTYTPYGVVTVCDASWTAITGNASQVGNTILFAGRELDITGLYYNRARYDDPVAERFINRDPIASTTNLYCYCNDNPLTNVDPTGMANISPAALACARAQLKKIKPPLSPAEIEVRMKILESLASTSGAVIPGTNGSCQDWANCTILNACGVDPGDTDYRIKTDKCTNTTCYTPAKPLDPSCLKPGDQIHFVNPYFPLNTPEEQRRLHLENGCNTFVVGKDCRGILLYNRWARCVGGSFVDGKGVMSIDQYCKWMATWDSVTNIHPTDPKFPINRVPCPLPPKATP